MVELSRSQIIDRINHPIFEMLSQTADELNYECYLVGGYVRDLFLERRTNDIDVVVVGSGVEFAEAFSKNAEKSSIISIP